MFEVLTFICGLCLTGAKEMKVIILAAGYGTRLQKDIENDPEQKYKHLKDVPKPLVPVGGTCLLSRWMKSILTVIGELGQGDYEINISNVYVVVSESYVFFILSTVTFYRISSTSKLI